MIYVRNKRKRTSTTQRRSRPVKRTRFSRGSKRKIFPKKTRNKSSILRGKPKNNNSGHWMNVSSYRGLGSKFNRMLIKNQAPYHYNRVDAFQVQSATAAQAVYSTICNWWGPLDMNTLRAATNQRFICTSAQIRLFATNQSNAHQFIEVYEIVNRKDIASANTKAQTPKSSWVNTGVDISDSTFLGMTPFQARGFTTFYKVLKITRYNLSAGQTFEHMVNDSPKKRFDSENMFGESENAAPTADAGGYKGLTKWLMIVQWSAPYNDSTTKTSITTGIGNVDYIFTKKYSVTRVTSETANSSSVSTLPQSFAVGEDIMIDESGAAAGIANA